MVIVSLLEAFPICLAVSWVFLWHPRVEVKNSKHYFLVALSLVEVRNHPLLICAEEVLLNLIFKFKILIFFLWLIFVYVVRRIVTVTFELIACG